MVEFVQGRQPAVQSIDVAYKGTDTLVQRVAQQMPIEALIMIPFVFLGKLVAHEEKFLPWVSVHEGVVGAQIGETLPSVAGHAAQYRALAVHDFVVRKRQNEILIECIKQTEGQLLVMMRSVDWVECHVVKRVVHPAHVPLEAE